MPKPKITKAFRKKLAAIKAKRPKTVIDHIVKHGFITTDDLKQRYGYNHPPRAARDVRDCGIPLESFRVKGSDGRNIAAYRFGDPAKADGARTAGRKAIGVKVKNDLVARHGARCAICGKTTSAAQLQVDHRVPYVVAPDDTDVARALDEFMLVCQPCNRAKSWSCEQCDNWKNGKKPDMCRACYWASPDNYNHVAMTDTRRLDLTWQGEEVADYGRLKEDADQLDQPLPAFVKQALKRMTDRPE